MTALPPLAQFQTVADVVAGLAGLGTALRERRDRRAVFASGCLAITRELERRLAERAFADPDWVAHYLVAFADLYRRALYAHDAGLAGVPKAWTMAFAAAAGGHTLVLQDLLLGINAHINHDLPLALDEVSIDPDRESRYRDHRAVNDALRAAVDGLQARLAALYAPGLALLDRACGPLDERLTLFSLTKAREAAWEGGVALANAHSEPEKSMTRARLDDHAGLLARLLLVLPEAPPWLPPVLGRLERGVTDLT